MEYDIDVQTKKVHKGRNACMYIVLHHTGGNDNFESQWKYLAYSPAKASCHYVVGHKGEIAKISDDEKITWHAGVSEYEGLHDLNRYSIGIEIVSGDGHTYTDKQRDSVEILIEDLMKKHSIPWQNIIRHKDITSRKRDVGDEFRSNRYADFDDYKFTFSYIEQMNEKEKELLIYSYMNLGSVLYNLVMDEELKILFSDINDRFRELGFDNRKCLD